MNTQLLNKVYKTQLKTDLPPIKVGDTIAVKSIIREGDKKRFQTFKGIVIAIKGSGVSKNFTIRKISFGVGVEKIIPFHSPNIASIELLRKGSVRRSKLYYLRDRVGKRATRVKQGKLSSEEEMQYEELKNLGVVTESDEPVEEVVEDGSTSVNEEVETVGAVESNEKPQEEAKTEEKSESK